MKTLLAAATALMAFTGAAFAADIPVRAPAKAPVMVPPPASWTGCYIGVGAGYGLWNDDHQTLDPAGAARSRQVTSGGRGWFGTAGAGCDYQFAGTWLVGVFGDYDFASMKGDYQDSFYGHIGQQKLSSQWAVGARIGWLPWDSLLTFLSAGYTQATFDGFTATPLAAGATTVVYPENTYSGWFLGSGYEYKLSFFPGLTWKTEYRFSYLDSERLPLTGTALLAVGDSVTTEKYVQTIRSSLVWRFNFR